jgi:hypothetical protein
MVFLKQFLDNIGFVWQVVSVQALIGAYFDKVKGKLVLRIALTQKGRNCFESLW